MDETCDDALVPLREQEFREICTYPRCKAWASTSCPRCGRPLCEKHDVEPERRCEPCEQEFAETSEQEIASSPFAELDAFSSVVGTFVMVWVTASIFELLDSVGWLLGVAGASVSAAIVAYVVSRWLRNVAPRVRRRFLAERHRPAERD